MNSLEKTSLRRSREEGEKGHAAVLFSVGHPFKQLYYSYAFLLLGKKQGRSAAAAVGLGELVVGCDRTLIFLVCM